MTTWQAICADILLVLAVAILLLSCLGMLVMRDTYNRLHYLGPAATLSPILIAAAVVLEEALSTAGIKAILIAVVLVGASPVLGHATARAIRISRRGAWQPQPDEPIEDA